MDNDRVRVLFLCTGNSARSQLAEALLGRLGGSRFEAFSAGTQPGRVNPYTVRVLAEEGIDWSDARSKSVAEFLGQPFDFVVTVCDNARETCPNLPGRHAMLHWSLEDPAAAQGTDDEIVEAFRRTRDDISARLQPFVDEVLAARI